MRPKADNRKVKKVKKSPIQYTLDFDVKGLIFFVFLSAMTALVIFYLGWIIGKGSRNPSVAGPNVKEEIIAERTAEKIITAEDLDIYNIREGDRLADLKDDTRNLLKEADRVLAESKKPEKKAESVTKAKPTDSKAATPGTSPTKSWPDQPAGSSVAKDLYTVQVFATKDRDKAERIVRLLKEKEFEAYLATATIEGQAIYRVRVGRKSKKEIEKLDANLKKVIGGMGMKSRVLKIK